MGEDKFEVKVNMNLQKIASDLINYIPTLDDIESSIKKSKEREDFLAISLSKMRNIWITETKL